VKPTPLSHSCATQHDHWHTPRTFSPNSLVALCSLNTSTPNFSTTFLYQPPPPSCSPTPQPPTTAASFISGTYGRRPTCSNSTKRQCRFCATPSTLPSFSLSPSHPCPCCCTAPPTLTPALAEQTCDVPAARQPGALTGMDRGVPAVHWHAHAASFCRRFCGGVPVLQLMGRAAQFPASTVCILPRVVRGVCRLMGSILDPSLLAAAIGAAAM